jgi:hypothetical protein
MKSFLKLLGVIALTAVIGFSLAGCAPVDEEGGGNGNNSEGGEGGGNNGGGGGGGINPTITIKNNTGYTVGGGGIFQNSGIWIKPSTTALSWGDQLFAYDSILDGQSRTITLSQPYIFQ